MRKTSGKEREGERKAEKRRKGEERKGEEGKGGEEKKEGERRGEERDHLDSPKWVQDSETEIHFLSEILEFSFCLVWRLLCPLPSFHIC